MRGRPGSHVATSFAGGAEIHPRAQVEVAAQRGDWIGRICERGLFIGRLPSLRVGPASCDYFCPCTWAYLKTKEPLYAGTKTMFVDQWPAPSFTQ